MNEFWEVEEIEAVKGSRLEGIYTNEDSEVESYIILSFDKYGETHHLMFTGGTWHYEKKRTSCPDCCNLLTGEETYCPNCGERIK